MKFQACASTQYMSTRLQLSSATVSFCDGTVAIAPKMTRPMTSDQSQPRLRRTLRGAGGAVVSDVSTGTPGGSVDWRPAWRPDCVDAMRGPPSLTVYE